MDKSKVKTVTQIKADQPCENKRQALSQIKRIDWSSLEFRTPNQKKFYRTIGRNDVTFSIGPAGEEDNTPTMHIHEASQLVSETEGRALFDSEGETAFLKSMQTKLSEHYQNQVFTRDFINLLLEHNLLKEIELIVTYQDEKLRRVKGLYTINEEELAKLDQDTVMSFFKRNLFVPIYAMLSSLTQFNRLMKLNNQNEALAKITRLQMRTPDAE